MQRPHPAHRGFPAGTVIIYGGASGADALADHITRELGFQRDWRPG